MGRHLERRPRARRGLLEDQRDVLADQVLTLVPAVLRRLEVGSELQQELELVGREVELLEEASVPQVEGHLDPPRQAAARAGSATVGASPCRCRRRNTLMTSSTTTSVSAKPRQIPHCPSVRSTIEKMRCRKPISVTRMIAASANPYRRSCVAPGMNSRRKIVFT